MRELYFSELLLLIKKRINVTELGSGKHSFMKNLINMKTEFIVTDKKKELGKGIHLRKKTFTNFSNMH